MSEKLPSPEENIDKIPEIDSELIKHIESLNLYPLEKGEIILVKAGVKPSAWITADIRIWNEGEPQHIIRTEKDVEDFISVIKELNVPSEILPREIEVEKQKIRGQTINVYRDHVEVRVASNQENLDTLHEAIKVKDHALMGHILGIPETAVEAFVGKSKKLNPYKIPKEIILSDAFIFSSTNVLSEDNWQNELKEGEIRAKTLEKVSPKIFEEMKRERLKSIESHGLLSDKTRSRWSKKDLS